MVWLNSQHQQILKEAIKISKKDNQYPNKMQVKSEKGSDILQDKES